MKPNFTYHLLTSALVLCAGLSFAGCAYTSEISRTKQDIEAHTTVDAHPGVVLAFGPGLFHTAGFLAKFVDDQDAQTASRLAYSIRRVKAGVYPLDRRPEFDDLDIPELARFRKRGWKTAVKVEADEEVGWMLYRERRGRVRDLFVVVLTGEELVLARLQGNLTELLDLALDEIESDNANGFFDDWGDWES